MITAAFTGSPDVSNPLKTLFQQLWKNLESLPGWVPLVAAIELGVAAAPEGATYLGLPLERYGELIVGTLSFLAYQFGDALDKPFFKNFKGSSWEHWLKIIRIDVPGARNAFIARVQVKDGSYSVALDLLKAGGEYAGSWVHGCNELAKFFRSAVLPVIALPLLPVYASVELSQRIVLAAVLFLFYLLLKPWHMQLLYSRTLEMLQEDEKGQKFGTLDLDNGIRLFFWKGSLVTSARLTARDQA